MCAATCAAMCGRPGSILVRLPIPPMPDIIWLCFRKSLKSNFCCMMRFVISSASSALMDSSAFSTSVSTSPIPAKHKNFLSNKIHAKPTKSLLNRSHAKPKKSLSNRIHAMHKRSLLSRIHAELHLAVLHEGFCCCRGQSTGKV